MVEKSENISQFSDGEKQYILIGLQEILQTLNLPVVDDIREAGAIISDHLANNPELEDKLDEWIQIAHNAISNRESSSFNQANSSQGDFADGSFQSSIYRGS